MQIINELWDFQLPPVPLDQRMKFSREWAIEGDNKEQRESERLEQ
jgi:hypothetical protein